MKAVRIILAIALLLCLCSMPYGYYTLIRFACCITFAVLAIDAKNKESKSSMIIYIAIALLFQPFFKIALGREIWNILDIVTAMILVSPMIKNYFKR